MAISISNNIDKNRIIFIFGGITREMSLSVIQQLLAFNATSNEDITIYINSEGGSVYEALAIIDVMNCIDSDVSIIVCGQACSAASLITVCGTKGKRYITPYAQIMIHNLRSSSEGTPQQMADRLDLMVKQENILSNLYVQNTNCDLADIQTFFTKDTWFDAENALDKGIVDKILGSNENNGLEYEIK
ncbi:MAG: ClpP family protease [Erysipelotrichaceae bacterium]